MWGRHSQCVCAGESETGYIGGGGGHLVTVGGGTFNFYVGVVTYTWGAPGNCGGDTFNFYVGGCSVYKGEHLVTVGVTLLIFMLGAWW